MKRVILIGGFGYSDIGDESQLTTNLINFRKFVPDAQFLVLSDNPDYTRKYHKVEADHSISKYLLEELPPSANIIKRNFFRLVRFLALDVFFRGFILLFNAHRVRKNKDPIFLNEDGKKFLENLKSTDLIFNVGGGNINSIFRFGGLYAKCFTYILCRTFGKPVVLSGQSIGPFSRCLDKWLAKFSLNRVNVITLREKFSRTVLEQIGVTKPLIKVTADDSTLLSPVSKKEIETVFSKENIPRHQPLIGVNMIKLRVLPSAKLTKARKLLAKIADYLISEHDARIVFVPMSYKATANDRIAASEVLKLMKHKDKAHILVNEYNDHTIKGVIEQMDLAIGLRYHFIVFAVNSQVPSIGIYTDNYYLIKIRGILELVGQGKYACNIEETSLEDMISLVEEILSNKETIRKKLKERTKELGKLSLFSVKWAVKLLLQH